MRALITAIADKLRADATVVGLIGKIDGAPNIIFKRPAPAASTWPVVIVGPVISDVNADAISSVGRQIAVDISVKGRGENCDAAADAAERIRNVLHRSKVVLAGWQTVIIICSGPVDTPAEANEVSRVVTVNVRLHQP